MNCLRSLIKIIIKPVIIIVFTSLLLPAQQNSGTDTLIVADTETFQMQKSPWGAVGRSAVIPGWGQFYNEDYLHIPVIWGLLGWFGYQWVLNNDNYKIYRDSFIKTGDLSDQSLRYSYRDQRDKFAIYFVITYLLNLVDAYVGAHMFDFSVEEDYISHAPRLKIFYRF